MKSASRGLVLAASLAIASVSASAGVYFGTGIYVHPAHHYWGYGPYWGYPAPYPTVRMVDPHTHSGQLKFDSGDKKAEVFIDHAYAGSIKSVDSAWLPEGKHSVEVRSAAGPVYDQDVEVIAGRTLHIKPVESK